MPTVRKALTVATREMLFGVGVVREDGEGAVELLGEDDAGQLVRHGERRERKGFVGAGAEGLGETRVAAAEENEFAGAAVAEFAEPAGEFLGAVLVARGVEEDPTGSRISLHAREGGGGGLAKFADANIGGAADARGVVVEEPAALRAAGAAEKEEMESHGKEEHDREEGSREGGKEGRRQGGKEARRQGGAQAKGCATKNLCH
jgi:hypothetical protein